MSKIDYVIREDGSAKLFSADPEVEFLDATDILEDYPYIVDSMEAEGYYMENDLCYLFDEILFENKVVGFATFQIRNKNEVILTECYILPQYRGNRLFFNELSKFLFVSPNFGILQPTKNIVELLISYAYAKKVTDDIVVSAFDFYFDDIYAESNKKELFSQEELPVSNFYDLSICSTIFVEDGEVIYHDLVENDLNNYGKRKDLTNDYFDNIIALFRENQKEYDELIIELKNELPQEKLDYDVIVGHEEGLSVFMQGFVDNEILSYDKAVEIKQQLIREYEAGEITDETIDDRLSELVLEESPDLKELMTSPDASGIDELFELIGDNKELGEKILNAIFSDDLEEFYNLIFNEMNENEEFFKKFINYANQISDDDDDYMDDEYEPFINSNDKIDNDFDSLGLNLDSPYPIAEMMWGPNDDKYKLDNTFYGKDYPISHDIYIFRVLNTIKKTNSLKLALAVADMKGSTTSQFIELILTEQNFINDKVTYENWDEFAHDSLTVVDLKDILRENNLKVSGNKQELIDRIAENKVPLDEFKSDKVFITQKGEEFLEDNMWIKFYDDFLNKFDFNDYLKYLDNNEGEFIETTLNYLEEHLALAKKENNEEYKNDCLIAYSSISEIGEKYLKKLYDNN